MAAASSASGLHDVASGDEQGSGTNEQDLSAVQATPLPELGLVALWFDIAVGAWYIGHKVTCEVKKLDFGDYTPHEVELRFDEDGFGVVVAAGADDAVWTAALLELFKISVFTARGGAQYILEAPAGDQTVLMYLDDVLRIYALVRLRCCRMGSLLSTLEFQAAIFEHPRPCGCHVMWDLASIVRGLELDPAKPGTSMRGKWLHNRWPAWEAWLESMEHPGTLMKSQQYYREGVDIDADRCLPWPSASSGAVVAIVARLLSLNPQYGGIVGANSDRRRESLKLMLRRLVELACASPWTMRLRADPECELQSAPAPPTGQVPVMVEVGQNGALGWLETPDSVRSSVWDGWTRLPTATLGDLLLAVVNMGQSERSLAKQVFREVGLQIDAVLMTTYDIEREVQCGATEVYILPGGGGSSSSLNDVALEAKLCRHLRSGHLLCKGDLMHFSFASDSSRVGSTSLMNAIAVLPDNHAWSMPPQVAMRTPASGGGSRGRNP